MNTERINRMIAVLEDVQVRSLPFNISFWAYITGDQPGEACGTTCCAAGWGALDPELQAQGLVLVGLDDELLRTSAELNEYLGDRDGLVKVSYNGQHSFSGLAAFFDISKVETKLIFDARGYPYVTNVTPAHVIERLKRILAEAEPAP